MCYNLHKIRALHDEFMDLLDDLERGNILMGDMGLENVVRAEQRGGRLVVIDGLGEWVLLPLTLFSKRAYQHSILRRRKRMSGSFGEF